MSNPTESNPSLGPLLPLYNTSTGQTDIAWDVDPSTVATDTYGVTHGKAFISGTFSSTPPSSVVSTNNSTTTLLTANAVYTGTSESVLSYGSVSVEVYSDQASASNGLSIQQSQDGSNWDTKQAYTVSAATPFQQTVNIVGQYLRVVYTNGSTNQGVFRLQTIKMPSVSAISSNASVGTNNSSAPTSSTLIGGSDGTNLHPITVSIFHNADNQSLPGTAYGILAGGVAQILNASGNLDRQRGTGFDGIPAVGVATGTQQLAGPALSTTFGAGGVTGSTNAQNVLVGSTSSMKVGDIIVTQDNAEYVEILSIVDTTHCNGIFKNNHAAGQTLTWYHYNQARDATVGDAAALTGMGASATYLYNNVNNTLEFDRSANGERDGATGQGTSIAAGYGFVSGGPLNNSNVISGLTFDRERYLQGKGLDSGTISNNPLAAGSSTLTLNAAPTTLNPGQAIVLDRAGANPEGNFVGTGYTPGSTSVPLQNATAFSHAQNATVEWDKYAPLGPQLNGFLGSGLPLSEEVMYDPVSKKYFVEIAATADGNSAQNIVLEGIGGYNGATYDRILSDLKALRASLFVKTTNPGDTALTLGQVTSANSLPVVIASDQSNVPGNIKQINGSALSLGQATMANSLPVAIASNQGAVPVGPSAGTAFDTNQGTTGANTLRVVNAGAATGTKSNVAGSATSVTILAANTARKGAMVYNDSTAILYLDLSGGTASSSSYSVQVPANGLFELPGPVVYNGAITGIWASATGNARVTEFS